MGIISEKTAGILSLTGLFLILTLSIAFSQSFLSSIALFVGLTLAILFLYSPFWGAVAFLIVRPAIDYLGHKLYWSLGENFSINATSLLGVLFLFLSFLFLLKNKTYLQKILKLYTLWTWILFIIISIVSVAYSINFPQVFMKHLEF